MANKAQTKRKKAPIKRLKRYDKKNCSLLYIREYVGYQNAVNQLHNETLSPLKRRIRAQVLTRAATQEDLLSYEKEKAKAIKKLDEANQEYLKASSLGEYQLAVNQYRVSDAVLRDRDYLPTEEPEQPGTRVVGGAHPCCVWYERLDHGNWYSTFGPVLAPDNKAMTNWYSNWIGDNKLRLQFDINGTHDDEYTDAYIGYVYFFGTTGSLPRRGKLRTLQFRVYFENAYAYVRGSSDFWDSDDYGWSGGYYMLTVDRVRAGTSQRIFNTWNNNGTLYRNTEWQEHYFWEQTSAITAQGWPGGANAPYFYNIPDIHCNIFKNNSGSDIIIEPGDRYNFTLGILFYVNAYGDEGALGGVNIRSMYGSPSHMEIPAVTLLLEECEE